MNDYIEHLLQLYKDKKISHEAALSLLEKYKALNDPKTSSDPIAVVGLSCKMPLASSKEAFWEKLSKGIDCVTEFPEERRKDTDWLIPILQKELRSQQEPYWKGGFLADVDLFDNEFFHITPAEAKIMDPQQRLFLELTVAALEDAGIPAVKIRGSNGAVFVGDVVNEYRKLVSEASPLAVVGNISPFIASRVSHYYDLHGPAINVSTTCSTSLVAVHLACQSLLSFETDLAITGAVNMRLFPFAVIDDPVDALGITTDKGACLAFDDKASGIVRGEGAAVIVLKRLSDAIQDRNPIYALIRSTATNNDGKSSSVGAPNPLAQAALLKKAWQKAGIDPTQIDYIETHGTGTRIGDPIEIQGIAKAFSEFTQDKQFCAVGSVKTNIGHLTGGASGLASLVKTVLALKQQQIPPTLHFETPNSFIDFPNTPVYVASRLIPWTRSTKPRLAGVSAFGFNGSNCHVVLEEAPIRTRQRNYSGQKLPFLFSHRTVSGLKKQMETYLTFFRHFPTELWIEDISYTLIKGRTHHPVQSFVLASSMEELIREIEQVLAQESIGTTTPYKLPGEDFYRDLSPQLLSLPTYAFEQKRFWLEPKRWRDDDRIAFAETSEKQKILPTQQVLLSLFSEVLGLESVTTTDSFFEAGGDSLAGMEIIHGIHKQLQKKISYQDLFNHPRVVDLLKLLEEKDEGTYLPIPHVTRGELSPLSYGQRRLWILHHMQDHPVAYNIYDTYHFDTQIDEDAFQKALDALVERHAALRTVFIQQNGEPFQTVIAPRPFDLTILQAKTLDEAKKKIADLRNEPFDLEKGPLAKALLIQLSPTSTLFFFLIHHIIADGWSIRIIIEELLAFYRSLPQTPTLRIDSVDYCHWQKDLFASEKFQTMHRYWLGQLAAPLPVCEIPGDKIRPAVFHFQGARKKFSVSEADQSALTKLGSGVGSTLFMVLLSSVYTLINKYTGQTDLIVGSPVAGRSHPDLIPLVGFFVNTLAIRCQVNPKESFESLLVRVKEAVLGAMEHQDYPFDHLIDQLKLERDTSRSPLFNINVAFQNFELNAKAEEAFQSLRAKRVDLPHQSCKWDLEFEFVKQSDGSLECFVEYYVGIYSEAMIESLIGNYRSLLQSIVSGKTLPMTNVCHQIAGPIVPLQPICLHELFEQQVQRTPHEIVVRSGHQTLSFEVLNSRANQLAQTLHEELKIKPESLIGIYLENSVESIVAILAILKAGGAFVPLDIQAPLQRTLSLIEDAKIEHLLSQKKCLKTLDQLLWSSSLHSYLCLDVDQIDETIDTSASELMSEALWNQVALESSDEISSSGWVSSYTGLSFSVEEMEEYAANVRRKLEPYLHPSCRVLEIGCGSGLTAFALSPFVKEYVGLDLSSEIVQKNTAQARIQNQNNLIFHCAKADEIDALDMGLFDLVIINSVIHCFPHLPYLQSVLKKAIGLCHENAHLFLGDLMDLAKKGELEQSLRAFKETNRDLSLRTKTDWSQELFIAKDYLADLRSDLPAIVSVICSQKLGKFENELTRFRYDALLQIDRSQTIGESKHKKQLGWKVAATKSTSNLALPLSDRMLAYVLFTSGSTGKPKGVMVEHRSVHNYIAWAKQEYGHNSFPFYSPLHFDLTMTSIFTPLLYGGSIQVLRGQFDEVLQTLKNSPHCNICKLTPAHLTMMIDQGEPLNSVHHFIVGGEALYAPQVAALSRLYSKPIRVDNEYGPTEATVGCINHTWQPEETEGALLIGRPIANTVIHLVDETLQPVPIGAIGEILIGGEPLARGYLNNQTLTDKQFILFSGQRCYRTGDLGRCLPSGKIVYLGRKDRQVKIKGYRIELDEIESQIVKHPLIVSCAVVCKNDPQRGKTLCGYYLSRGPLTNEELSQFLATTLPQYMIPTLISLPVMPMTRNGKIDTSKLPDLEAKKTRQRVAPTTKAEKTLLEIWSKVLGVAEADLSLDDDFFDLGGDSIMAMRMIPKLKAAGFRGSIKEIFQHRTIQAFVQKTDSQTASTIDQSLVEGQLPWTPIQHWFWEQNLAKPAHFNMAYLFRIPFHICKETLHQAFWTCFTHHDALRLIFTPHEQKIAPLSELLFQIEEFVIDRANAEPEILRLTTELQSDFDLSKPPLVKAAIFDLGAEKKLFIWIHHLIIDGVSWRYLVEDLTAAYHGEPLALKTHSFKDWAHALHTTTHGSIDEWLAIDSTKLPTLSKGLFPLYKETVEETVRFTEEETKALLSLSAEANINELLLAGLAESLFLLFGFDKWLIDHEGHGRDGPIDVSRTMGWFTTIYPLCLEKKETAAETLVHVQQSLRKVRNNDIAYGLSRYLHKHPHLQSFKPEILLNYFGRVDEDLATQGGKQFLTNCEQIIGPTIDLSNRMPHLIEMNAMIIDNRLRIAVLYNPASLPQADRWFATWKQQVMGYARLCV